MKTHYRHHLMTIASSCGNNNGKHSQNPYEVDCRKCERSKVYKAAMASHSYQDPYEAKEKSNV